MSNVKWEIVRDENAPSEPDWEIDTTGSGTWRSCGMYGGSYPNTIKLGRVRRPVKEVEYELVTDTTATAEPDWEQRDAMSQHWILVAPNVVGLGFPISIREGRIRRPKRPTTPAPPAPAAPQPDEHTKLLNYFLRRTDPAVIAARWPGGDE